MLILQPFRHFTYVTTHSPTLPSLHLPHNSLSNPSVTSPTSQLTLQPFRHFTYVTAHSPTLLSVLPRHRIFTYVTWRAAHDMEGLPGWVIFSFAKGLPARCTFIFGNRKKSDGARSGLYGGCPNGIALVSAGQYADVQLHARACLFGNITWDLIGLQKTNNTSHLTVGGILTRHNHGHSYLCTYHVTRPDVQLHEAIFNITLNTRN